LQRRQRDGETAAAIGPAAINRRGRQIVRARRAAPSEFFAIEAAKGALDLGWWELRLRKIYTGHHPDNHASRHILERLGFTFLDTVFYEPTGLLHPPYVRHRPKAL
jgi:hypothetical protein